MVLVMAAADFWNEPHPSTVTGKFNGTYCVVYMKKGKKVRI